MSKSKLGIAYNVFDGEELLEKSILSVRNTADYICVVWQRISNMGNFADPYLEVFLNSLKTKGLIDELIEYVPRKFTDLEKINMTHPDSTYSCAETPFCIYDRSCNQITKRNIGRLSCKNNGCSYFMSMDSDEFYQEFDLKTIYQDILTNNYATSFALMKEFFKKPIYQIKRLNNLYLVPVIQMTSLELKVGAFNTKYFNDQFSVDPTRCVSIDYTNSYKIYSREQLEMYHMTYVRNNIMIKYKNASRQNNKFNVSNYINNWKFGDPVMLPNSHENMELIQCQDIFNIGDISNHVSDLDYYVNKGNQYNKDKQYLEAIQIFDKILAIYPENIHTLYNRATSYLQLGQQELSIKDLNNILTLCPRFQQAKQLLDNVNSIDFIELSTELSSKLSTDKINCSIPDIISQDIPIMNTDTSLITDNKNNFIIHQIWYQGINELPGNLEVFKKTWRDLHPDTEIDYWDNEKITKLIGIHYPEYQEFYHSLPKMIMKIDLAKLFILGIQGGLYVDMDFYCLQNTMDYFIKKTNISAGYEKTSSNISGLSLASGYIYVPSNQVNKNKIKNLIKCLVEEYLENKVNDNQTNKEVSHFNQVMNSFGPYAFKRFETLFDIETDVELFYSGNWNLPYMFDTLTLSCIEKYKQQNKKAYAIHLYSGAWRSDLEVTYYPNNFITLYRNLGAVLKYGWNIIEQCDSYPGHNDEAVTTSNIELLKNNCLQKNFTGFVIINGACFFRNIDPNKLFLARNHNPNATLYILTKNIPN